MSDLNALARLLSQVEAFRRHEFDHRVVLEGEDPELAALAHALNTLGQDLEVSVTAKGVLAQVSNRLWKTNKRLDEIARIDPLTKLLNRRGLEAVLSREAERAARQDSPISAVLIDCDDFKRVNDLLGHAVGDQILQEFTRRLLAALRTGDQVGRVGGDEFLAIMPDTRFHEAMVAAERIRIGINQPPLRINDTTLDITASMGVATLPLSVQSIEEVLTLSRMGLKHSKQAGKNRVSGGSPAAKDDPQGVLEELRTTKYFRAVAHPILTVSGEDVVGYELLSRREHEPYRMPSEFFRIALESDVLTDVDLTCAKVCIQEATDRNLSGRLHVNLFPSTLLATDPDRLLSLFPEKRDGESYCVELSEQQFIGDPAALKDALAALKQHGVRVAVDDVGFGRTSLETLLVLEPDIIKIDRQYITGVAQDEVKSHRLERMVHAVGTLGADLVAEGVERREDLDVLADLDLPFVQGYLWGQPA